MYLLVIKQLLTMFLIGVCGFVFAKVFKVEESQRKFLSKLLLYLVNPCMILNSFNKEFDAGKLEQLLFVVAIAFVVHGAMIFTGLLSSKEAVDRLGVAFTNCGFIGIPLIRGVFGDEGVFFLMGYIVVFNILIWSYGYSQLSCSANLKKILTNPNIIACFIGLLLFCLPFTIPAVIATPLSMVADVNTALSMILIGVLLANFDLSEGRKYVFKITKLTILRLIVAGLINIAILFVVYKLFGNFPNVKMLIFVVLISSSCPMATNIPSMACAFGKDSTYASIVVSITSVLCILTLPALVALAEVFRK